jgi:carboxyl-terminal processing protease
MKKQLSFSILFTLLTSFNYAQSFKNLNFQQTCDSSKTGFCNWDLSWGAKNSCTPAQNGNNRYLSITGLKENSVGFVEQSVALKNKELQVIELSASIRCENVQGKGAGLNVGIYDADGNLLATKDMGGFYSVSWLRQTRPWKRYTIRIVCPENAATIKIGAILYGKGKAGFDDYAIKFTSVKGRKPSTLATNYIDAVCDTIAKHSLVRDSLDITRLRTTALEIAGPAKSTKDCYLAVEFLIESLRSYGDEHSFLMKPEEVQAWQNNKNAEAVHFPESRIIENCGYIKVPPFHSGDEKLSIAYADSLQEAIRVLDAAGIRGWIIDLRENTGGNMSPMIAGLGPLFDEGPLGYLVDVNGKKEAWSYKNGIYYWEKEKVITVPHPVVLSKHLPIAVLTGSQTGSSGETVVISFIGNGQTRSFGQPTWGLTTGNGAFDLPDGARMMLASTVMADRNMKIYHGSIPPDERIEKDNKAIEDQNIKAAINWIMQGQ